MFKVIHIKHWKCPLQCRCCGIRSHVPLTVVAWNSQNHYNKYGTWKGKMMLDLEGCFHTRNCNPIWQEIPSTEVVFVLTLHLRNLASSTCINQKNYNCQSPWNQALFSKASEGSASVWWGWHKEMRDRHRPDKWAAAMNLFWSFLVK